MKNKSSWKGSLIAEIPLRKRKFVKRLCDSQNSIVREKVCEEAP
jgi:hypothetical protein